MTETVVVVGATGAMGRVVCQELLGCGFDVLAVARSSHHLHALADHLPSVRTCETDISQDSSQQAIRNNLGYQVRAVVHGPGVTPAGGICDAPTHALTSAVNIKVGGLIRLVRACEDFFSSGSRIIAIGGHYGFEPTAYAATAGVANAALANVVRQLSWAYGDRGITSHLIAPGPADTERLAKVAAAKAERDGVSLAQVFDELREDSAIGEFTSLESIAWAVLTLLDKRANALAGSTLFMDSGRRRGLP